MTAKEFVLQKYPDPLCIGITKVFQQRIYKITSLGEWISQGLTESKAWVNAKKNIIEQSKNETHAKQ